MKHDLKVTLLLIVLFFGAQMAGLAIVNKDIKVEVNAETGLVETSHAETIIGPRPEIEGSRTVLWMTLAILIGTVILLVIIRFHKVMVWKTWFFFAVFLTIAISLGVFLNPGIAYLFALILAIIKIYKPGIIIHNVTEVLIYSGIAVLFVPLLDVKWTIIMLLLISVYDIIAVFKSKHMITMAKFQSKAHIFAGFTIPYAKIKGKIEVVKPGAKKKTVKTAILGGGDIAFPMIFGGVVMEYLINTVQLTKTAAFATALITPLCVTIALSVLLFKGKPNKFYPAMPFVTAGCLIGYGIIILLI